VMDHDHFEALHDHEHEHQQDCDHRRDRRTGVTVGQLVDRVIHPQDAQYTPADKEHRSERRPRNSACAGLKLLGRHLTPPVLVSDRTSAGLLTRSRSRLAAVALVVPGAGPARRGSPDAVIGRIEWHRNSPWSTRFRPKKSDSPESPNQYVE